MTELERALVLLGDELAFPDAPDVSERVLGRLAAEPRPAAGRVGAALVLAFAVLALALGAAMAVPQARTAILEFFRLRGATVQRVESLPGFPPRPRTPSTWAAVAAGRAPEVKLPRGSRPGRARASRCDVHVREPYGTRLTLVYEPGEGVPASPYTGVGILVSEFVGEGATRFVEKMVDAGPGWRSSGWARTRPSGWKAGRTRSSSRATTVVYEDHGRLAGNTLLVERNDVLVRIEGEIDRGRAIEIAESLELG